ncbi:hypothetical protein ACFWIW_10755 [Amycolatopsis sp. NPDC058340]|uniref:hypothetical protein n=1 Tax=Amycolatopsis sp. NPDC058340 TaxID=3346453 RepID=UPI00364F8F90
MVRRPYHISRQQHLGDTLDKLQDIGALSWRWEYDFNRSTALYWIALAGEHEKRFETRNAERLVQKICDERGIVWKPVPHPGGENLYRETLAWIAAEKLRREDDKSKS